MKRIAACFAMSDSGEEAHPNTSSEVWTEKEDNREDIDAKANVTCVGRSLE